MENTPLGTPSSYMKTFGDLGMPFPLFRAPSAQAVTDPAGSCAFCGAAATLRFSGACYDCLSSGKLDSARDTELGMVTVDDAIRGRTHGLPLDSPPSLGDYELVAHPVDPNFPDETWYHVRISSPHLLEMLRSPNYQTWQGESWQFCCKRPCMFLGSLPAAVLPNAGSTTKSIEAWFRSPDWDAVENHNPGSLTHYVFQCVLCSSYRHHEDYD